MGCFRPFYIALSEQACMQCYSGAGKHLAMSYVRQLLRG